MRGDVPWPGITPDRAFYFDTYVFPVLEGGGVPRDALLQAWDFVTASASNTVMRGVTVRDDALQRICHALD